MSFRVSEIFFSEQVFSYFSYSDKIKTPPELIFLKIHNQNMESEFDSSQLSI